MSDVDIILNKLKNSTKDIEFLQELNECLEKRMSLSDAMSIYENKIVRYTEEFLKAKNEFGINYITGISTCIYLPSKDNKNDYTYTIIGGTRSRNSNEKINQSTLFDVASITKLFTLILLLRLNDLGLIDLNAKICDINPDFQNLEDYTLYDLMRLHGVLKTKKEVEYNNRYTAYENLKTLYLEDNSRDKNNYNDYGALVIANTIEKIMSEKLKTKVKYKDILNMFVLYPLDMMKTTYNPETINVAGNANSLSLPHDPKTKALGGVSGSSGIFTNSKELCLLAKDIINAKNNKGIVISKKMLDTLGEVTFPNDLDSNKGNLGLFIKHPGGLAMSYVPDEFSPGSFASQGWTGSVATFDPTKRIHQNILVNAIYNSSNETLVKNDKPKGYDVEFKKYQNKITKGTIKMKFIQEIYSLIDDKNENIEKTSLLN